MKLRNKKTREVLKIYPALHDETAIRFMAEGGKNYEYKSLADFNKEWEDAPEEPKSYWFINTACDEPIVHTYGEPYEMQIETGNHFETREEAERAYEKLKAWKRLKDGGITFKNWAINQTGTIDCFATWGNNIPPSRKNPTLLDDLDLLFSGEDD